MPRLGQLMHGFAMHEVQRVLQVLRVLRGWQGNAIKLRKQLRGPSDHRPLRGEMHPFGAFGTTFPPEGELIRWTEHSHFSLT